MCTLNSGRGPWQPLSETTTTAAPALLPPSSTPPRIEIPKTRPLKLRFGFPCFSDMERKFNSTGSGESAQAGSTGIGKQYALAPHESAAERWRAMVHEMLVEVVDQQGKAVVIARHLLTKSASGSDVCFVSFFPYAMLPKLIF